MAMTRFLSGIRNFIRRENGTQMIEFAIVFPVLLLLFAGTVELGRLFYHYTTLAKATRAGARYLSTTTDVTASTTAAKNVVLCGNAGGCGGRKSNNPVEPNCGQYSRNAAGSNRSSQVCDCRNHGLQLSISGVQLERDDWR